MGFIIVIIVLALSAWAVLATVRRLRQTKAGRAWWLAFALLLAVGCGAGAWFAFRFEYQVSPEMRYASFPVPLAFFHLEQGRWVDFITPPHVMYPGLVANVASFAALALLPLFFASRVAGRKHSQ
jgi:heme A synthase